MKVFTHKGKKSEYYKCGQGHKEYRHKTIYKEKNILSACYASQIPFRTSGIQSSMKNTQHDRKIPSAVIHDLHITKNPQ